MVEKFEDYQIAQENTLDFEKLLIQIKEIKAHRSKKINELFKDYKHSLFSPILYYLISYKNEKIKNNEEIEGFIGNATIHYYKDLKVLYAILNEKIYNLFFQGKKDYLYDEKIKIDFEIARKDEEYSRDNLENEKELKLETLEMVAMKMLGEKDKDRSILNKNNILELYEFKKKEVISHFRYGYSIQERLISFLLKKDINKQLFELPNIIFFQKNMKHKIFSEMDRIFLSKSDITFDNAKIYSKYISKDNKFEIIKEGEFLKMEKDFLNFIEVKSSIMTLSKEVGENYIKEEKDEKKKR